MNIALDLEHKPRKSFRYLDKGIMAMIGRNAAIAEVGAGRRPIHGFVAFVSWLGVHVALLTSTRRRLRRLSNGLGTISGGIAATRFLIELSRQISTGIAVTKRCKRQRTLKVRSAKYLDLQRAIR